MLILLASNCYLLYFTRDPLNYVIFAKYEKQWEDELEIVKYYDAMSNLILIIIAIIFDYIT